MQGVLITHKMVLSAMAALVALIEQAPTVETLSSSDSYFSYLPLAHVFGTPGTPWTVPRAFSEPIVASLTKGNTTNADNLIVLIGRSLACAQIEWARSSSCCWEERLVITQV